VQVWVSKLRLADVVIRGVAHAGWAQGHAGICSDRDPVHIERAGVADVGDGHLVPDPGAQCGRAVDDLFRTVAARGDGEADGRTGGGRQEHISVCINAKIEEACPGAVRGYLYPGGDTEVVQGAHDAGWGADILRGAAQVDRVGDFSCN